MSSIVQDAGFGPGSLLYYAPLRYGVPMLHDHTVDYNPMRSLLRLALVLLPVVSMALHGQEKIASQAVVNGEMRRFVLYIPSSYDSTVPNPAMLALHPLNPQRWDAESWADTLTAFAEDCGLLLLVPDGGADGDIGNEETDTMLATGLLDLLEDRYSVDSRRIYVMGFSMGGRATYRYGLANAWRFGGYIPIGAAVSGAADVADVILNAEDKPFYLVHGELDAPGTRFTPLVNALLENGAVVETRLMQGVNHTIDFPDRNAILGRAFKWVDSVNLAGRISSVIASAPVDLIAPNPVRRGEPVRLAIEGIEGIESVTVVDVLGRRADVSRTNLIDAGIVETSSLPPGGYLLIVSTAGGVRTVKLTVL